MSIPTAFRADLVRVQARRPPGGPARRAALRRAGLVAVLVATGPVITGSSADATRADPATPAAAVAAATARSTASDCASAHLGPKTTGSSSASYFSLHIAAGRREQASLVAANPSASTCTVVLSNAHGQTAVNSGDSYVTDRKHTCPETACWISDLPTRVELPPGSRISIPFTVHVPGGTRGGQYLAGIVGEATTPNATGRTHDQVRVKVRTQVAIGVAVTVPGPLTPRLTIPTVTVRPEPGLSPPGVAITEANPGNTWEHPTGTLTVRLDADAASDRPRTVSIPLASNTVLPRDQAVLQAAAHGVAGGIHPVRVELWYANHTRVAIWEGWLNFSPRPTTASDHGEAGATSRDATDQEARGRDVLTLPSWLKWAAIPALVVLLVATGLPWLLLLRRRRHDDEEEEEEDETT